MYTRSITTKPSLSAALGTAIILLSATAFNPASAANRNTILDKLEAAPSSWQTVELDVSINGSTANEPVVLGKTVTIKATSSQPANFLLAIVDSYGNVRIARPANTSPAGKSMSASYEYKATQPVGSYSTYSFASDATITDDTLGLPASGAESYLPIGVKGVDQFLATLTNHSGKIARTEESPFFVEDENLTAMRGIRKSIAKLTKNPPRTITPATESQVHTEPTVDAPKVAVAQHSTAAKPSEQMIPNVAMIDRETTTATAQISASKTEPKIKVRKKQPTAPKTVTSSSESLSLDIKFQISSQELTQSGINALDTLGSALLELQRSNALPRIILEGHTDDTGDGAYNLILSQKRANSARDYLLHRFELPKNSVSAQGYGESAPKVANVDSSSRKTNRRVELRVVSSN